MDTERMLKKRKRCGRRVTDKVIRRNKDAQCNTVTKK